MSYLLPHLQNGWEVDQAIVTEEDRVVVLRFGRDTDPTCMVQDEVLGKIAEKVSFSPANEGSIIPTRAVCVFISPRSFTST